ncbi:trypsin-like peptidase domain-containing protein [Streptomyces sp. NBC_00237]|uniref:nSTAND1 domain-containing NTPase n=1 Tax=Streptomyces sp. NBC_00237 TaxID=2975687 RepID=UPI002259EE96|nr:trypsin-like peptidase domain-containing protein [Streptomyces sp. NBC_00237]MCX5205079.1 trypsin-like peptidase domain-containing protein [Streptomyces sp. NBC_00237]
MAVVQICSATGGVEGVGFLAAPGVVVTCAHVAESAGVGPGGLVRVVFDHLPGAPGSMAEVVAEAWRPRDAEDVAFLRVQDPPAYIAPLALGPAAGNRGHRVRSFGHTSGGREGGHFGYGVAGDLVPDNRQEGPALQLTEANDLTQGFSGGPVVDETTGLVIGMVNSVTRTDAVGRLDGVVFATPTQVLRAFWPDLEISDVCPFRGLEPFAMEHAAWFHGRTAAQDAVINALTGRRDALMLLGPSGSGKTSLVQAGVLPALARGAVPGSDRWLPLYLPRPGPDLLAALGQHGLPGASTYGIATAALEVLAKQPHYGRVLLVIDQFEELFTHPAPSSSQNPYRTPAHVQAAAEQLLQTLASHAPVTLVLVMRNDFYPQLTDQTPALKQALQPLLDIPALLTRTDLHTIVTGPLEHPTASFETGLPARIINDILTTHDTSTTGPRQQPARTAPATWLTALQLTLLQLWQRRDDDGRLTHSAYDRIGTITGALATWCQHAVDQLPVLQQPTARQVLTALVHPPDTSLQLPASRRSLPRETLHELLAPTSPPATVDTVLTALTQHRIVTLRRSPTPVVEETGPARKRPPPPVTGRATSPEIELVHDSLIRDWPALGRWIAEDQEFYSWLHRTEAQHTRWTARKRAGDLLHGTDLAAGLAWIRQRGLPRPIAQFVRTSHRRTRLRTQILTGLLVLALIAAGLAAWQRQTAVTAQQQSLSRQLAAQSAALIEFDADLAALLAVQAYRTGVTKEALARLYQASELRLRHRFTGHTSVVSAVAFSPDGRTFATASWDGTARLWDTATGRLRATLTGHALPVYAVAFSLDSRTLATASRDNTARLWDVTTGRTRATLTGHTNAVSTVAFSPDGRTLATASSDNTVRLWDAATGDIRARLTGHTAAVSTVAFSSDGRTLATASWDGRARLWDIATGHARAVLTGHADAVSAVVFSPDGRTLVTASRDRTARLWDVTTGRTRATLTGHTDEVSAVVFSPDGRTLVTASRDRTARLWDVTTGRTRATLTGHTDEVSAVVFSPDGRTLVTASWDRTARLWDAATGRTRATLTGHADAVSAVVFSPDGRTVATGGDDGTARLWDTATTRTRATLTGHTAAVFTVVFSPDGRTVATGGDDGTARLWDTATGHLRATLTGHTSSLTAVVFSPDGRMLATASNDNTTRLWDTATGHIQGTLSFGHTDSEDSVFAVVFSPDGRTLATASSDNTVRLWDAATGGIRSTLTGHADAVSAVVFSPDGRMLATASNDNTARLWDTATGRTRATLTGHTDVVSAVVFSPDGRTLATASFDRTARLWDTATGHLRAILTGHTRTVFAVVFSPDGRTLATASSDGAARLWDTATSLLRATLTGHTGPLTAVVFSPDGRTLATASSDNTARLWDTHLPSPSEAIDRICQAVDRDLTSDERATYLSGQESHVCST